MVAKSQNLLLDKNKPKNHPCIKCSGKTFSSFQGKTWRSCFCNQLNDYLNKLVESPCLTCQLGIDGVCIPAIKEDGY
jgi:hypothetical protein